MLERIKRRLRALRHGGEMNVELDAELRYHLERQIEENVRAGMSPEEARYAALRTFGNVEESKAMCREARGVRWIDDLYQDLRFGLRNLAKRPGFTAVALVTLALGIGANSAIFSVVDNVLLRPLPFEEPDRLVVLWEKNREGGNNVTSPLNFTTVRAENNSFDSLAATVTTQLNLTGGGEPEQVKTQLVTEDFFRMLGRSPVAGRILAPEDHLENAGDVVVLSYGLWQRRFGGDPNIVGSAITLHGEPLTVVGIMPRGFDLTIKEKSNVTGSADLWAPLALDPAWKGRFLKMVGRLKPGVTVEAARSEMAYLASNLQEREPQYNAGRGLEMVPLRDQLVGNVRPALLILAGAVGLVLLIACANVANLLLMRAASRRRELAIRAALGAGRFRVVRQLLTESLCLSVIGGLFGLLLAVWGTDLLLALAPTGLLGIEEVQLDWRVLAFTMAISVVTGLVFGLVPALQASKVDLNGTLNEGGRHATADRTAARLSKIFVVSEVALALVLLIGAGLLLRSFATLQAVDPGFDPEGIVTAKFQLPNTSYPEDSQALTFYRDLLERVRALPGVQSASVVSAPPFGGSGPRTSFVIEGRPAAAAGEEPSTDVVMIDPEYFQTMSIPLLEGRTFTPHEMQVASHVIIVSESFARQYFPGESALGKRIEVNLMPEPQFNEIVGIVGDVRNHSLEDPIHPMVYWPHAELPTNNMTAVVNTSGDSAAVLPMLRTVVRELDPNLPIADMRPLEDWMAESLARSRFMMLLLGLFGAVAFVLAVIGIYGVLSYAVALRTSEIGIRMALGAQKSDVLRMVLLDGLRLSVVGLAVGLVAAILLNQYIASLLYGITGTDMATYLLASLLFLAVSILACVFPARRAVMVDPMVALR